MSGRFHSFEGIKGYATFANAQKRGQAIADSLDAALKTCPGFYSWMVIAKADGRFLPVFACNNLPGGPGMLLGETNIGIIN